MRVQVPPRAPVVNPVKLCFTGFLLCILILLPFLVLSSAPQLKQREINCLYFAPML
ncbi:hypothetical protein BACCAP_02226 [Pseudoflavonifractor capillosus ATCC 29799]|uniref:Uncharacterized protein n=1 Tax=Pseudoflavonifractor capillosus ATCC 29799 TaxID=411467 RepID=A6NVI5_9FIRM|nr:hypothetical protein BACCAP_02226 [Pseudoflavonifractor capillosus ATCC 29799]